MYMIDFSDSPWSGTPDDLLVGTMMGRSLLPTYIFKQRWACWTLALESRHVAQSRSPQQTAQLKSGQKSRNGAAAALLETLLRLNKYQLAKRKRGNVIVIASNSSRGKVMFLQAFVNLFHEGGGYDISGPTFLLGVWYLGDIPYTTLHPETTKAGMLSWFQFVFNY